MWGLLIAWMNTAFAWLFRAVVIKFVLFTGLMLLLVPLMNFLVGLFANNGQNPIGNLGYIFGTLPLDVSWFMGVVRLDLGVPMLLAAFITAFFIRRLPFVG